MKKIKIAQFTGRHIIYLPLYLALQAGFLEEEGLETELYRAGNDNDIFNEVANGQAEFGVGDPTFAALGSEKGIKTKVIAALINNMCLWGITHHEEIREIKEVTDLVGLRLGSLPRPSTTFALLQGLKRRHQRILKDLEIIEAPIGEQVSLLSSGKADVIIELEPMVTLATRQGLRTVLSLGNFYGDFLLTGVTTSQKLIDQDPDLIQSFVRGLQKGLNLCHEDPERTLALAHEMFPTLPLECLEESLVRLRNSKTWPTQALIQPSAWLAALELRLDIGDLKSIENPEQYLDQSFAYNALTQG